MDESRRWSKELSHGHCHEFEIRVAAKKHWRGEGRLQCMLDILDGVARLLLLDLFLPDPLLDEPEDLAMPAERVGRLVDPMVLVRKVEEAARDASSLERVEDADAFRLGKTKVEPVVDDESGRRPILDVVLRVPLFVLGLDLVRRPSNVVLGCSKTSVNVGT